jgi:hypothetical protein
MIAEVEWQGPGLVSRSFEPVGGLDPNGSAQGAAR